MFKNGSEMTEKKNFKYYDFVMVAFVVVLLCSNLIGPGKVAKVFGISFGVNNIFFPIGYVFGDILTEVYGYARTRKVIWAGFFALMFATVMSQFVVHSPADMSEPFNQTLQPAIELIFGNTWRIVLGSIIAYWAGDFANSYVMAKMKIWTKGKHLWTRTIGSTLVGQGVDSLIFYPLAFYGIWASETLLSVILFNCIFKILVEVVMTPFTYRLVSFLKKAEQEDHYDYDTNFTPFSLETDS